MCSDPEHYSLLIEFLNEHMDCRVVELDENEQVGYSIFCLHVLWPVLHNVHKLDAQYHANAQNLFLTSPTYYNAYVAMNKKFLSVLIREYEQSMILFVHDYHLMLLPALLEKHLREKAMKKVCTFFLRENIFRNCF